MKEEAWNEGNKAGMEDGIERGMRTGLIEDVYKRQAIYISSKSSRRYSEQELL